VSTPPTRSALRVRPAFLDGAVWVVAAAVVLVYLFHALFLIRYPWDWAPDEGLYLDWARRVRDAPSTLYAKQLVPFPCVYTPLLPALLALFIDTGSPLAWGRILAAGSATLIAAATFVLVRRRAPAPLAAACVGLTLAPFTLTFWYLLVRVDGLMIALWMLAAVFLLPEDVARGADRLEGRRLILGTAALVAAVLTKQTAIALGLPLVACWLLVDRRSAVKLAAATVGALAATIGALDLATRGGFSYVNRWWGTHPLSVSELLRNLLNFLERAWPILLLCAVAGICAWWRGARPWRDGAVWLALGGLAVAPAMAKRGALWIYLLPLLCAGVVLTGRWWASVIRAAAPASALAWTPPLLVAGLSAWMASTHEFLLPDALNRRSGAAFYEFVREASREGPILAVRPDYAYFVAGQPVEIEADNMPLFIGRGLPEMNAVLGRLVGARYSLVVWSPEFYPREGPYVEALRQSYKIAGGCTLVFIDGPTPYTLLVPRASGLAFTPPAGTRCWTRTGS